MAPQAPVSILLVEDNPDHADLTRRALNHGPAPRDIFWVRDGEEALEFLHQRGRYADPARAPRPRLIFLDIGLPKLSGREVLRHIKSDAGLRTIPVVMLTTSGDPGDVNGSYSAGANSFISKPVGFTEFMEKIKAAQVYWLSTNALPADRAVP